MLRCCCAKWHIVYALCYVTGCEMLKQDTLTKTIRSVSTPEKWLPGPLLYQQFSVVHVTLSISWSQSQTRPPTPARSAFRVTRSGAADSDAATAVGHTSVTRRRTGAAQAASRQGGESAAPAPPAGRAGGGCCQKVADTNVTPYPLPPAPRRRPRLLARSYRSSLALTCSTPQTPPATLPTPQPPRAAPTVAAGSPPPRVSCPAPAPPPMPPPLMK